MPSLLDGLTIDVAEAKSPLQFAIRWLLWAPVYAGAVLASLLRPTPQPEVRRIGSKSARARRAVTSHSNFGS